MANSMGLDTNLLSINQISFTSTDIVAFYLVFNDVDAYFESIDEDKYFVFALTDKNR